MIPIRLSTRYAILGKCLGLIYQRPDPRDGEQGNYSKKRPRVSGVIEAHRLPQQARGGHDAARRPQLRQQRRAENQGYQGMNYEGVP